LLARAYVASGAVEQARRHVAATAERLRRELGTEPTTTLLASVDVELIAPAPSPQWIRDAGAVASLITAGDAAVSAGVLEPGFEILRRAVVDAHEVGDQLLEARALVALGTAFVHGARGRDGEGAKALHAAVALGHDIGAPGISSEASRELGYIELKQARYERAATWLDQAIALAPNQNGSASATAILGAVHTDQGNTRLGCELLASAAADARALEKPRLEAWALAFLGRVLLLREDWTEARRSLDRSMELARSAGWIAFLPFPQALMATVDIAEGHIDAAGDAFGSAFALGCQIGDPCWEGLAARGIGLVHWAGGRVEEAIAWLEDARTRCVRIPDSYLWVQAYCLDALCEVGIASAHPRTSAWVADLETMAARTGMYEFLVRAQLHRARLGDVRALDAALVFVDRIDNPAVLARLTAAGIPSADPIHVGAARPGG
jgi:tetratricopeptide (TPR) repeat protein